MKATYIVLALAVSVLAAGCLKLSQSVPSNAPVGKSPAPLQINSNLVTLSTADLQCVTRDALGRFASSYARKRVFRLGGPSPVEFYRDSDERPGTIDLDVEFARINAAEKFGDYATLPASVRSVVLKPNETKMVGGQFPLILDLREVIWSKRERKIQVKLFWAQTISESFTFLYKVTGTGEVVFLRSVGMGCSETEPGYFIEDKPLTPSANGRSE